MVFRGLLGIVPILLQAEGLHFTIVSITIVSICYRRNEIMGKSVSMRVPGPLAAQAKKVAVEEGLSDTAALQMVYERAKINTKSSPSPSTPTDQTPQQWAVVTG